MNSNFPFINGLRRQLFELMGELSNGFGFGEAFDETHGPVNNQVSNPTGGSVKIERVPDFAIDSN